MKNLMVYVNPSRNWDNNNILLKFQIDNSLRFGWKKDDILVVSNMDFEYNGVRSIIVGDDNFCQLRPNCTKINAILTLFNSGRITDNLYWFHDIDAFQAGDVSIDLGSNEIGIVSYGEIKESGARRGCQSYNGGVIYFNQKSEDIFKEVRRLIYRYGINDEIALVRMEMANKSLLTKIKLLNVSYNFSVNKRVDLDYYYTIAEKPIRVFHLNSLLAQRKTTFSKHGIK